METKIYQIEIGTLTKKGNLLTAHSFVCKTENSNTEQVRAHFAAKYAGFDALVTPVNEVVFEHIKQEEPVDYYGRTQEENDLLNEVNKYKQLVQETNVFTSSLSRSLLPIEAHDLMREMIEKSKVLEHDYSNLRNIAAKVLEEIYKPFCEKISFEKKIDIDSSSNIEYKVYLKGKLGFESKSE